MRAYKRDLGACQRVLSEGPARGSCQRGLPEGPARGACHRGQRGLPDGPEGLPDGPKGYQRGQRASQEAGGMDVWIDGCTDGQTDLWNLSILQYFVPLDIF